MITILIITIGLSFAQIDLSLDWSINQNFELNDELDLLIDNQISNLDNMQGILVIHNGAVVKEDYFNGGQLDDTFNIWSVTKSFISSLIGISIDLNFIENIDTSINEYFSNQDIVDEITVKNLLMMNSGYQDSFYWPFWYMQSSENLLAMPLAYSNQFYYNNSACHINSHLIYNTTGYTPIEFANIFLFPHLGIENPFWHYGYNNINDGSSGLHLTLRQMAKLGQLYLQSGVSGTNQVISTNWVEESTSIQIDTENFNFGLPFDNYGYLWWKPENENIYIAYGFGGQFLIVDKQNNLVIATSSNDWGPDSIENHEFNLINTILFQIIPLFNDLDNNLVGDLNNDLQINILDVVELVSLVLDGNFSIDADINNDNYIDVIDIVQLVNIILNNFLD